MEWNGNTAGLLLECSVNTEIAVHDNGTRLASFMYHEGNDSKKIQQAGIWDMLLFQVLM
jgi:hypothetical protein